MTTPPFLTPLVDLVLDEVEATKDAAILEIQTEGAEQVALATAQTALAAGYAGDAADSAAEAAQSAAYAGGFETPEYASQSAGNAATTPGQIFRVPIGTTPQTFNWYRRLSSGSELVSPLATSGALASNASGSGLDLIGKSTVAQMLASTIPARGVGSVWNGGGFRYVEAASGATDHDLTTAGGVKLYIATDDDQPVSVLAFHTSGTNIRTAYLKAVAAVKAGRIPSRKIVVPWVSGGWTVDQQTLCDASNIHVHFEGDVSLTATTAQHCMLFAPNTDATPATSIDGVTVTGRLGVVIDGNASNMVFPEPTPGTVDTYSAVRFNAITNLYVFGIHATNGPMDSMSCKRCPGHLIERCEMSNSLWDNGFSATTDPADYDQDDPATWGGGTLKNCISHDNNDVGMTAFNCSGQWFEDCRSYDNDTGFSYEDSFGTPNVKKYYGGFRNCLAFNCGTSGYYIDGDEVTIDDECRSYNIRGTRLDNTNNLYEQGVLVSSVNRVYIGGRHENNGRCGIALFNASGLDMQATISAECVGNDWHGLLAREQAKVKILSRAKFNDNGAIGTVFGGEYGHGIFATSTTIAMAGTGTVDIDACEVSGNAFRAMRISGYRQAFVRGAWGADNFQVSGAGSGSGIQFQTLTNAVAEHCQLDDTTGRQTFVVNFTNDVAHGRDIGTRGNFATGMVANASTTSRYSTKPTSLTVASSWVIPSIPAGSRTGIILSVPGAEAGDYVTASFSGDIGLRVPQALVASGDSVVVWLANFTGSSISGETLTVRVQVTPRNAR